jgi:membrane-anchored protein YejM (alkaline phosphatase superfamily)
MLLISVIVLFLVSFLWALWSLKIEMQKSKKKEEVKNIPSEEKIIYHV